MDLETQLLMEVAKEHIAFAKQKAEEKFKHLTDSPEKIIIMAMYESKIINRDLAAIAKFNGF